MRTMTSNKAATIDDYIAAFPQNVQILLETMRATIHNAAPEAEETISYQIPTFKLHRNLVHFAAFHHHIGFYPGAGAIAAFREELSAYKSAKGSVQFPLDAPLPLTLIRKIVKFRVKQNLEKAQLKKSANKQPSHNTKTPSPQQDVFASLAAPAQRALHNKGITSLEQLSRYSEVEILQLHGMGRSSVPKLHTALEQAGLTFRK